MQFSPSFNTDITNCWMLCHLFPTERVRQKIEKMNEAINNDEEMIVYG